MKIIKLFVYGFGGIIRKYFVGKEDNGRNTDVISIEKKRGVKTPPTTFVITKEDDVVIEETAYEHTVTMKDDDNKK